LEGKEKASKELNKLSQEERVAYLKKYQTTFLDYMRKVKGKLSE
jgi:hypothetical protein